VVTNRAAAKTDRKSAPRKKRIRKSKEKDHSGSCHYHFWCENLVARDNVSPVQNAEHGRGKDQERGEETSALAIWLLKRGIVPKELDPPSKKTRLTSEQVLNGESCTCECNFAHPNAGNKGGRKGKKKRDQLPPLGPAEMVGPSIARQLRVK